MSNLTYELPTPSSEHLLLAERCGERLPAAEGPRGGAGAAGQGRRRLDAHGRQRALHAQGKCYFEAPIYGGTFFTKVSPSRHWDAKICQFKGVKMLF